MSPRPRRRDLRRHAALARRIQIRAVPTVPCPLVPASETQRAKVAGLSCLVCERSPVDPAHLVPQRLGGCAHPDCVVPLCRTHHRLYDHAQLRLGVHLPAASYRELRHALEHASGEALFRALDGGGWPQGNGLREAE